MRTKRLNIHYIDPLSRANGPGIYFTIWFQGCTLNCAGCFNPGTHPTVPNQLLSVADLSNKIKDHAPRLDGITITGGEPLLQTDNLLLLLTTLQSSPATDLPIILFSGHTFAHIQSTPHLAPILNHIDILIAGPYISSLTSGHPLQSSANQSIHLFSQRIPLSAFSAIPPAELLITPDGHITLSGTQPLSIDKLK